MDGTVGTLDEVLQLGAEREDEGDSAQRTARGEAVEVRLCSRAMRIAQAILTEEPPYQAGFCGHCTGRCLASADPVLLQEGLDRFFAFIDDESWEILIRTAIAHLESEAPHLV